MLIIAALFAGIISFQGANISHFNLDDYKLIVNNPSIRGLEGIGNVLASGRPVRGLTFMLDYRLFHFDPLGYHLSNVLWHWLGTCLFYLLIFRIFGSIRVAGVAAFLFFVHPVHSEAVMSIAHRKEMLAFTFLLLSYHAFLYRKRYPLLSLAAAMFFFLVGIGSKQVVLILPLLLLVHLWLDPREKLDRGSLLYIAPFFIAGTLLLGLGLAMSAPFLRDFNVFGKVAPADLSEHGYASIIATSMSAYPLHLRYILFPAHFNIIHDIPVAGWDSGMAWAGVVLFAGVLACIYLFRSRFLAAFSLAWIFINLLPIMNFIPANFFFAERYLYIPSAGLCVLIAGATDRLFSNPQKLFHQRLYPVFRFVLLCSFIALVLAGPVSHRFTALWPPVIGYRTSPEFTIMVSVLVFSLAGAFLFRVSERPLLQRFTSKRWWSEIVFTYVLLAFLLVGMIVFIEWLVQDRFGFPRKDMDRAMKLASEWMQKYGHKGPRSDQSRIYLSGSAAAEIYNFFVFIVGPAALFTLALRRLGRRFYNQHPNRALAFFSTGVVLLAFTTANSARIHDWASELRLWKQAVAEDPDSALAWNNLGKAHFDRKNYAKAAEAYREAISHDPGKAENYRNLGITMLAQDKLDKAARAFEKALQKKRGDLSSRENLAQIYIVKAKQGQDPAGFSKAIPHYLFILEKNPGSAYAHHNLAYCYYRLRDLEKAMTHIMQAIRIQAHRRERAENKEGNNLNSQNLRRTILNAMHQKKTESNNDD